MMNKKLIFKILTLCLLAVFLPAMAGLSFIHHYCLGCKNEITETVFFPLSFEHEHDNCICSELPDNSDCCSKNETCSLKASYCEPHNHYCTIDYKKLEISATVWQNENLLPLTVELKTFNAAISESSSIISNIVFKELLKKFLFPPPVHRAGLNVINCIFRL